MKYLLPLAIALVFTACNDAKKTEAEAPAAAPVEMNTTAPEATPAATEAPATDANATATDATAPAAPAESK
ncbi:MAG: hypothetical protein PHX13_12135 [Thiovulaceae bacterium]|nr:hypothetical protein [Sulfurimonadaceae bacterium]